jgi:hypothetical protein
MRSVSMRRLSFATSASLHTFLHQQARSRAAHLPLVEPDRVDDPLDHAVEVRVLEDDERALAAQLERQLLAAARRRASDDAPTSVEPGERDLVDVRMVDDRRAGGPSPVTTFSTPAGQPRLLRDLGEQQRGQRRELAGLITIVQPAASAGATFHASISSGKFHGMICPTTPAPSYPGNSDASSCAHPAWW